MSEKIIQLGFDKPLQIGHALKDDKLGRRGFADSVVKSLMRVTSSAGFVVSVEGPWGSGKTSTLAMIEEILKQRSEESRPIVVHFNPWLVGERDALLGQFLAKLSSAVQLTEHAKNGRKAAKELKAYANVFDVVKLIPGAEPWASIVKSVIKSVGDSASDIVFSDIVGFAALMVKAPSIFELLRKYPNSFVGSLSGEHRLLDKNEEVIQREKANLELAYERCSMPEAARKMVHHLFPKTAKTDDSFAYGRISDIEGHIAAPSRLLVALQLSISGGDVSYTAAKRYLLIPSARGEIVKTLTQGNCLEFMESVGDMAKAFGGKGIKDLDRWCGQWRRCLCAGEDRGKWRAAPNLAVERLNLLVATYRRSPIGTRRNFFRTKSRKHKRQSYP
jgi:hypothetical protein